MEERTGPQPASSAWEADVLPFTPTLHMVIPAGVEPTFSDRKSDVLTTGRRDRICVFWGMKEQAENLTYFVRVCRRWHRCSHWGLASSGHPHRFCKNRQTLASGRYRFLFGTFFLAGFGGCDLLELHLLNTFSYLGLRPP